jgi:ATP-dependent protease ClpP protease subunit
MLEAELEAARKAGATAVVVDIDSPGGSVTAGLDLVETFNAARDAGVTVECRVGPRAMAASMAAAFLETACDVRIMSPTASLLFHEVRISGADGTEHDLRHLADAMADVNQRLAVMIAPRLKMSAKDYCAWVMGRDRWLDAVEATERNAIDVVSDEG